MPVFPKKDMMILGQHLKRAIKHEQAAYLGWCIQNWRIIMETYFGWMKDRPEFPTPRVLVRFSQKFQEARANREALNKRAGMTTRERMVADRTSRGMSQEAAEREADERLGLQTTLNEIKAERIKLQQLQNQGQKAAEVSQRLRLMQRSESRILMKQQEDLDNGFGRWSDNE